MTLADCKRDLERLGVVRYPTRIAYMLSLGPVSPDRRSEGHAGRAAMSLACAERSLSFWQDDPIYARLQDDLKSSIAFLTSLEPVAPFKRRKDDLAMVADEFLYQTEGSQQAKVSSICSLLTAMTVCLDDLVFQDVDEEIDAEVWAWDSAFHSATAFAGGAQWQADEVTIDLDARRAFWSWYVDGQPGEAARLLSVGK